MTNEEIYSTLEQVLSDLSIEVKKVKGYFQGGICRYNGRRYLYLNRADGIESHISLMVDEMRRMDLNAVHLPPEVCDLLDKSKSN